MTGTGERTMSERPRISRLPAQRRPRRHPQSRAGRADGDLLVGRRRAGRRDRRAGGDGAAAPGRLRAARAGHARDPRHARRVLRAPQRRRGAGDRARLRAGRGADAGRGREAARQAGGDHRHSVRGRNRPDHREGSADRRRIWSRVWPPAEREWCDISELILSLKCGGSDYTSGLASNPALGRVTDRLVDLGGSAVLGEIAEIMGAEHLLAARATNPAAATQLIQIITRVEIGSAGARPGHPRHAALARQHPRRPDDHRREVARRDAQGRRARAARGSRRLLRADHAGRG